MRDGQQFGGYSGFRGMAFKVTVQDQHPKLADF
jgi:hypothetical protein